MGICPCTNNQEDQNQQQAQNQFKPLVLKQELIQTLKQFPRTVCNKPINENEILFVCFTCTTQQENFIICLDCYMNGDHKGHVIKYFNDQPGGACDCGKGKLKCKNHSPENQMSKETYIEKIPLDYQETIRTFVNQNFTKIFMLFDKNLDNQAKLDLDSYLKNLNDIQSSSAPIAFFFMNLYQSPLTDFQTTHDCSVVFNNNNNIQLPINNNLNQCKCSLLENIFRYSKKFTQLQQKLVYNMQISLYFDKQFTVYSCQISIKMIELFISQIMFEIISQFQYKECYEEILSNNQFKIKYISAMKGQYQLILLPNPKIAFSTYIYNIQILAKFLQPNNYQDIYIKNYGLFIDYIQLMYISQPHVEIDNEQTVYQLIIDQVQEELFIRFIKLVHKLENRDQIIYQLIFTIFNDCIVSRIKNANSMNILAQGQQQQQQQQKQNIPVFDSSLRVLGILLGYIYLQFGLKEMINRVKQESKLENQELEKLFESIIQIQSGKLFFLSRLKEDKAYLMYIHYVNSDKLMYDIDYVLLQISCLFVSPDAFYNSFSKSLSIQQNSNFNTKKELQFFLENIIFININELPLVNLAINLQFKDIQLVTRNIRSAILNSFIFQTYMTHQQLMERNIFVLYKTKWKDLLDQLTDFNPETSKFSLKPEIKQKKFHEPYFWFKDKEIHSEYYQILKELGQKDAEFDSVIGNNYTQIEDVKEQDNDIFYQITRLISNSQDIQQLLTDIITYFCSKDQQQIMDKNESYVEHENIKISLKIILIMLNKNQEYIDQNQFLLQICQDNFNLLEQQINVSQDYELLICLQKVKAKIQKIFTDKQQQQLKEPIQDNQEEASNKQQQKQEQQEQEEENKINVNNDDQNEILEKQIQQQQLQQKNNNTNQQQQQFQENEEEKKGDSSQQQQIQQQQNNQQQQKQLSKKELAILKAQAAIKQKQQQFVQKNDLNNKMNVQDQQEEHLRKSRLSMISTCLICNQPNSLNNIIITPSYTRHDNLIKYYLDDFQRKEVSISINSCNHFVHLKCFDQHNKEGEKQTCPKCKELSNKFILIFDCFEFETKFQIPFNNNPNTQSVQQINQRIKIQNHLTQEQKQIIEQYKQTTNTPKISSQDLKLIMQPIKYLNFLLQEQFNNSGLQIIYYLMTIHIYERGFQQITRDFLKLEYLNLRSICQSMKLQELKISEEKFTLLSQEFNKLTNLIIYIKEKLVNKNQNFAFDYLWIQTSTLLLYLYSKEEILLYDAIQNLAFLFTQQLIIFFTFSIILFQTDTFPKTFQELQQLFLTNSDLQTQVNVLMTPYARLIAMTFITQFSLDYNYKINLTTIVNDDYDSDEQELTLLQNLLGKEFMKLDSQFLQQNNDFWTQFYANLTEMSLIQNQKQTFVNFLTKNPCVKFQITEMQPNYQQTHEKYFFKACHLCKLMPRVYDSQLHICLVCGQVLCSLVCTKEERIKQIQSKDAIMLGNINVHAFDSHHGTAIFMNLQTTGVLFVNVPISFYYKSLYSNQVGERFFLQTREKWNEYYLDKKYILQIQDLIFNRKIAQYMWSMIHNYKILNDNFCGGEI